ncbi:hypothetical protein [Neptuniibacter sp. QD37_11]|uniref:hypothetical protein n=1 Tax=Neptuniibacter sp. QD37_11 TaxID=3398209 RepID=UPI0039F48026
MRAKLLCFILAFFIPFAANAGEFGCFTDPGVDRGHNFAPKERMDKKATRSQMMRDMDNPAKRLFICYLQVANEGPASILSNHCGCAPAKSQLCSYNIKKKRVSASGGAQVAWCLAFAPWMM